MLKKKTKTPPRATYFWRQNGSEEQFCYQTEKVQSDRKTTSFYFFKQRFFSAGLVQVQKKETSTIDLSKGPTIDFMFWALVDFTRLNV